KLKRSAYDILGVPPSASSQEISKAYRHLVRTLHPDTHPEKKQEFIEVARAYELLKDDESRQRYDRYGDVDPESYQTNNPFQTGNIDFGPSFSSNRYPSGSNFGQSRAANLYERTKVVEMNRGAFESLLKQNDTLLVVNFYKAGCSHCISMKEEYVKLAELLAETVTVAAVNCARHQQFCSGRIRQYPEIILYCPSPNKPSMRYTGTRTAKHMQKWIWSTSPFYGTILTGANFNSWLDLNPKKLKIIYFSGNKTIPNILKALAVEYNSSISMGSVSKFENLLMKRFQKIPPLPVMLHIEDTDTLEGEWLDVETLSQQQISVWLSRILALKRAETRRYGGFSPYKELTKRRYVKGECASSDSRVSFAKSFGINSKSTERNKCTHFVAFRPKRQMYKKLLDDLRQPGSIDNFVEIVLSGSLVFTDRLNKLIVMEDAEVSRSTNEEL
ncbi:thioredoxin domain-containing protein, partial [Cardiosporidium cionae]